MVGKFVCWFFTWLLVISPGVLFVSVFIADSDDAILNGMPWPSIFGWWAFAAGLAAVLYTAAGEPLPWQADNYGDE